MYKEIYRVLFITLFIYIIKDMEKYININLYSYTNIGYKFI